MQKALTDKTIEALKPEQKRYEVHDLRCPGLSLRITPNGRKTFTIKFRYGLQQKRMKLGVYPRMSLSTAREKANALLQQVDEGIDPTKRRRTTDMKVENVCREFISQYAQCDIREIKRWHVLEIMDAAQTRGAHYQANRILSHVRKLFNWCVERGILDASPILGLKPPAPESSRERFLTDDEIKRVLRACRNEVYPFRQIVPMLLATAQRRGELTEMRWSEIDLEEKVWVIPAERAKNGKKHYVPLSLCAQPARRGAALSRLRLRLHDHSPFAGRRLFEVAAAPLGGIRNVWLALS